MQLGIFDDWCLFVSIKWKIKVSSKYAQKLLFITSVYVQCEFLLRILTLLQDFPIEFSSLHFFKLELILYTYPEVLHFTVQDSEYCLASGIQALLFQEMLLRNILKKISIPGLTSLITQDGGSSILGLEDSLCMVFPEIQFHLKVGVL